jgi:hypothetical protein
MTSYAFVFQFRVWNREYPPEFGLPHDPPGLSGFGRLASLAVEKGKSGSDSMERTGAPALAGARNRSLPDGFRLAKSTQSGSGEGVGGDQGSYLLLSLVPDGHIPKEVAPKVWVSTSSPG